MQVPVFLNFLGLMEYAARASRRFRLRLPSSSPTSRLRLRLRAHMTGACLTYDGHLPAMAVAETLTP